jgi:endonuclease/exonuclease/phosphatase family metal-dependent hydrolase
MMRQPIEKPTANSFGGMLGLPVVGIIAALSVALSAIPANARDLKIAAWNIEHLAERNGEGCRLRQEVDYEEVRTYVRKLDADVVALSEIDSAAAAARVFDPATYTIEMGAQPPRPGYRCKRDDPSSPISTQQHVGFAIKKGIAYQRNPNFVELDVNGANSLRWGVDVTLTGAKPLRLLAVHLKASCPGDPLDTDTDDCRTLRKQQPILEEQWMEQRYKAGEAFVVLGDFNRRLLRPNDEFWRLTNDGKPKGLKLTSIVGKNEAQCSSKYRDRIDHIVVDGRAKPLVKANTFEVMTFAAGENPSDHCPISTTFKL